MTQRLYLHLDEWRSGVAAGGRLADIKAIGPAHLAGRPRLQPSTEAPDQPRSGAATRTTGPPPHRGGPLLVVPAHAQRQRHTRAPRTRVFGRWVAISITRASPHVSGVATRPALDCGSCRGLEPTAKGVRARSLEPGAGPQTMNQPEATGSTSGDSEPVRDAALVIRRR